MMVSEDLIQYICLVGAAARAMREGRKTILIEVPNPWRNRPKGFPRGELACVNSRNKQARYVNAKKVYDFCKALEMEAKADGPLAP